MAATQIEPKRTLDTLDAIDSTTMAMCRLRGFNTLFYALPEGLKNFELNDDQYQEIAALLDFLVEDLSKKVSPLLDGAFTTEE